MPAATGGLERALEEAAGALGLALDPPVSARLLDYLALMQRWSRTYNLTSVREPQQMLTQHVVDCLAVVPPLRRWLGERPASLLDVGSGGGLPGVILATMLPQLQVSCVDAVGKKAAFVRQVAGELGLSNLHALHARVEALGQSFDIVTSRAFASLLDFCALTRRCLARDGVWMAMKGPRVDDEMAQLRQDVSVFHVEQLSVPGMDAQRFLVWMRPA